ncbi:MULTISPECIES: hypothetical protein [unclassified Bradyrhizobium]|uniref:hypothetical protein n=1 Tax=unclassified Bradyrhizobium TaxID=2631580 RepID=UPI00291616A5|nr:MULTISPECIES: hypothetical protein [unclassified Bradyrhizobium]
MTEHRTEFAKRRPRRSQVTAPPAKRSGHVALLLMGTLAVGGGAYALMPSERTCDPQPNVPGQADDVRTDCTRRSGGGSGGSGHTSHYSFFDSDSDGHRSTTPTADAASSHATRGGFGSFAHAFGFSGGG